MNLEGRNFLKELDFTPDEYMQLLDLAGKLKEARKSGHEEQRLQRRNIALLFEKDSTRTRCAFEVASREQGANVTYLGATGSQMGKKESIADTARVLSRFFDGIEYRGFAQERVEKLARYSSVPVWNGLTDEWHPTQVLADLLTMKENSPKALNEQKLAFIGDARNNVANSLMIGCALAGLDFRSISPVSLKTCDSVYDMALKIAEKTGAKITRTTDISNGVKDCDFIYTDVWLSMGEDPASWQDRIKLLLPYQVNAEVMRKTENPNVRFLHCLPAFHDRETSTGEEIYQKFGLDCMEVSDEVFESGQNLAFEEAENRLHTIKAVMVATLGHGTRQDRQA